MSSKKRAAFYHGLLLVDKPKGLTSHDVVAVVRRLTGQKRVGHTGTLDPMATGLMAMLLGEATRLEPYLVKMDKIYTGSFRLGLVTDTNDVTGRVLKETRDIPWPDKEQVRAALQIQTGERDQVPPAFSAVKVKGRPAYKAARAGESLELAARRVTAHRLELGVYEPPEVKFLAEVSSGYYIRSLVRDLGDELNLGAALSALRRERVGTWTLDAAYCLDELKSWGPGDWTARLLPPDEALPHWPVVRLGLLDEKAFRQGRQLAAPGLEPGQYKVLSDQGLLIGLGAFTDRGLNPFSQASIGGESPRGPFLRPLRVFNFGSNAEQPDGKE